MGQSLNNIKRRINTINSTRKITSSMKLVSNVKCRRFMVEEYKQREYSSLLRKIILDCIKLKKDLPNDELPPLIREKKKTNKRLIILVSSTLGLCGGYNSELFKFFNDNYKRNDEIIVIGEKARVELSKHDNIKIYTRLRTVQEKRDRHGRLRRQLPVRHGPVVQLQLQHRLPAPVHLDHAQDPRQLRSRLLPVPLQGRRVVHEHHR